MPSGTKFKDLPENRKCPVSGRGKHLFVSLGQKKWRRPGRVKP
ncbi:MAG: hypothetical protein C4581_04285 [Nitrospiraceae bacterium]|nr:MAG: hypothetical protein C4581_04285 [Nitrospiraceae bacterium]